MGEPVALPCTLPYADGKTPELAEMVDAPDRIDTILDIRFLHADMGLSFFAWLRNAARVRLCAQLERGEPLPLLSAQEVKAAMPRVQGPAPRVCPDSLEAVIPKIQLPSLPQVFFELQALLEREDVTVEELGQVVSMDPNMTGSILRLVNSSFFSFRASIDTVSRAVTVLGTRQISSLALGALMLGLFRERPCTCLNLELFWQHSIATGMVARSLALHCGRENPEKYFVAGLIHDLGWLALACAQPEMASMALEKSYEGQQAFHDTERSVMGFNHADLGARLFEAWALPPNLVAAVRYHHAPMDPAAHDEAIFVHIADAVVKGMGYGTSADSIIQPLDVAAWGTLGLAPEALGPIVSELDAELGALCRVLLMH